MEHAVHKPLKMMSGVRITHVSCNGLAPAHLETIGGQWLMMFDDNVTGVPAAIAGRLRALGVTTAKRWQGAPGIPAIGESMPGFEVKSWYGLLAPAGTPHDIILRLNTEVARGLREQDACDRFYTFGAEPMSGTPGKCGVFIHSEMAKWAKVVKAAGIRVE